MAAMHKGCAARKPVPNVDSMMLFDVMDNYVKVTGARTAFFYGPYENISKSQAAYGPGLAHNFLLLSELLKLVPAGEVKASVLKGSLLLLADKYDGLSNNSSIPAHMWAANRADGIITMLYHLRRVRTTTLRAQQLHHKATDADLLAVEQRCLLEEMPDPASASTALHKSHAGSRASSPGNVTCFYPCCKSCT